MAGEELSPIRPSQSLMDHHQQAEELFHAALGREPAERAAFLAQACGSDLSLLAA